MENPLRFKRKEAQPSDNKPIHHRLQHPELRRAVLAITAAAALAFGSDRNAPVVRASGHNDSPGIASVEASSANSIRQTPLKGETLLNGTQEIPKELQSTVDLLNSNPIIEIAEKRMSLGPVKPTELLGSSWVYGDRKSSKLVFALFPPSIDDKGEEVYILPYARDINGVKETGKAKLIAYGNMVSLVKIGNHDTDNGPIMTIKQDKSLEVKIFDPKGRESVEYTASGPGALTQSFSPLDATMLVLQKGLPNIKLSSDRNS